jgi:hypothetical protein
MSVIALSRMPRSSSEVDVGVEQLPQPEVRSERRPPDEPGFADDVVVVEAHLDPIQAVRRYAHRKGAFRSGTWAGLSTPILPGRKALFADGPTGAKPRNPYSSVDPG